MYYSPAELKNIQRLAKDTDLKNVLLAFELIRGRGLVSELVTDLFWIYNRMIWAEKESLEQEVYLFFESYWRNNTDLKKLSPLLDSSFAVKQSLHPNFKTQVAALGLNLSQLARQLYFHFRVNFNPINSFLFKHGTEAMQEQILPFLKVREHTGHFLLDLGGFDLKTIPTVILHEKHIHNLKIWGNDLEELPDFWDQFKLLEVINIAENKLKTLPASFAFLSNLQKLYAQNNCFDAAALHHPIQQLPHLKYLALASHNDILGNYSLSENKALIELEELVNHGKIHSSEKEQLLFLGLFLNSSEALMKLSLMDLFKALSDSNEETRNRAKAKILNWEGATFNGKLPTVASIAILGIVSFATRKKLSNQPNKGIQYTTEINKNTTHIVIGDYPENYEAVQDRCFVFMVEEDL